MHRGRVPFHVQRDYGLDNNTNYMDPVTESEAIQARQNKGVAFNGWAEMGRQIHTETSYNCETVLETLSRTVFLTERAVGNIQSCMLSAAQYFRCTIATQDQKV